MHMIRDILLFKRTEQKKKTRIEKGEKERNKQKRQK